MKITSLNQYHLDSKAKMVDFSGWQMPLFYKSALKEHQSVRSTAGIFDISHMSEFMVDGEGAKDFISHLFVNSLNKLKLGQAQYSSLLNEKGGMIDDVVIYKITDQSFMICSNAANFHAVNEWLNSHVSNFKTDLKNISEDISLIALQGPSSIQYSKLISEVTGVEDILSLDFMTFRMFRSNNKLAMVSRGGYTGEDGFEIFCNHETAKNLWSKLLEAGIEPIGLAARDSLRLEAGLLLHGKDCNDTTTPFESGIGWIVGKDQTKCIGKDSAIEKRNSKNKTRLYSFLLEEKGVARDGMAVFYENEKIGEVTSGTFLPTLGTSGGFIRVNKALKVEVDHVHVDIRGKMKSAIIKKRPLYKRINK